MPVVALPNGTELDFPDGMSEDAMRDAIFKNFPDYAPRAEAPIAPSDPSGAGDGAAIMAAAKPVRISVLEDAPPDPGAPAAWDREMERQSRRAAPQPANTPPAEPPRRPEQSMRPAPEIKPRGVGGAVADTVLGLGQGAVGLVKGVADNWGAGDNPVSDTLGKSIQGLDYLKSDELRNTLIQRDGVIQQARRNGGELAAARAALNTLFAAPQAAGDVAAQGAGSLLPIVGLSALRPAAMWATNALANAGSAASQTADALRRLPPADWQNDTQYLVLMRDGATHDEAVATLAPIYALPSQGIGFLTGALSGRTGVERALAGRAAGDSLRARAGSAGAELLGEQAETLAPQATGNLAVGSVDQRTGITEGLGQASVDTLAGAAPGAGLAAALPRGAQQAQQPSAEQMARDRGFLKPADRPVTAPIAAIAPAQTTDEAIVAAARALDEQTTEDTQFQAEQDAAQVRQAMQDAQALEAQSDQSAQAVANIGRILESQNAVAAVDAMPAEPSATEPAGPPAVPGVGTAEPAPALVPPPSIAAEMTAAQVASAGQATSRAELAPETAPATVEVTRSADGGMVLKGDTKQIMRMLAAEGLTGIPSRSGVRVATSAVPQAQQMAAKRVQGAPIDREWSAFTPESGTRGVPRADMPQIKAEHRGALTQFVHARGIQHEQVEVPARDLKPTQAEFSPAKVQRAKNFDGGDRSILISSDGYILDGHHQWLAKLEAGEPVKAIRLDAPIEQLLAEVQEFPSARTAAGAAEVSARAVNQQEKPDAQERRQQGAETGQASAPLPADQTPDAAGRTAGVQPRRAVQPGRAPAGRVATDEPAAVADDRRAAGRGQDRRQDAAQRRRVQDMDAEEMRRALLTHELTGIQNRRAWEDADKKANIASIDADSLKWLNDNLSPDAGDGLLKAVAARMADVFPAGDIFHISGDEFIAMGDDAQALRRGMARVQELLDNDTITETKPDGTVITKTGLAVTTGYGKDKSDADQDLKREKRDRETRGERAGRGEEPPGVVRRQPARVPAADRDRQPGDGEAVGRQDVQQRGARGPGVDGGPQFSRAATRGERNLIIQHNLTAENLLHALRIGGIPVPSLAVTKADSPLTNFGDITLLGNANMATPGGDTKVFGADIYSPRYPRIEYKLDRAVLKGMNEKLKPFSEGREIYSSEISSIDNLVSNKAFKKFAADKLGESEVEKVRFHDLKGVASGLLAELGAEERIFQGFTYSGSRRYIPHTLDNVVKILKKELRGGENYNYGVGSVRARYTPQFRSLASIRKEKGRLVTKEEFENVKKEVDDDFFKISDTLRSFHPSSNSFGFNDSVSMMMSDAAKMGLPRAMKENGFDDVSPEAMEEVSDYLNKLRNLPTEYFEAKITRAVDVGEFAAAVIPDDTNQRVVAALRNRGVKTFTYKAGDEKDRARVTKQAAQEAGDDVLFSRASVPAPSTVTSVQSAVADLLGGKQLANSLGRVVATTAAEIKTTWEPLIGKNVQIGSEGEAGVAQGFYDQRTKTVFLIADNINQGDEGAVLAHELMHKFGEQVLGEAGWNRLHGMIGTWKDAKEGSDERRVYDYAAGKVASVGEELSTQELFPYAVEGAIKQGIKPSLQAKRGTVANWLESVRQSLKTVWGKITGKPETFKVQDLVDLAFGIAQMEDPENAALRGALAVTPENRATMEKAAQSAIKAANEELKAQSEFAIEKELNDIQQNNNGADLSDITGPEYWDAENEEFTQAGYEEVDRRNRALAEERAGFNPIQDLSELNGGDQTAQAEAFEAYATALGLYTKKSYSTGGSRYVEVLVGEQNLKFRFADHFNTTRDTTQQPDFNVAPGRNDFTEAISFLNAKLRDEGHEPDIALSRGSQAQTDTPAFRKWFGDSVVTEDGKPGGKPIVVYHGTSKSESGEAFKAFDTYASNYGLMGQGGYFTADPEVASSYTNKGKGTTPTVYPAYLSIKNPIDMDAKADPAAWQNQFDGIEDFHEEGDTNESWYRAAEEMITDQEVPMYEGAEIMQEGLRAMGHDGITHMGGGRVKSDGVKHRVYVAFDPEQIKSATGNSGAFDPSNPDIRFSRGNQPPATGGPGAGAPNIWSVPDTGRVDRAIYELQDSRVDLKRVQEAITKTAGQITEQWDARLAETLYPGRVAYRSKQFLDTEVAPLLKAMAINKVEMDELADYLHARGAEERNAQIAKVNPDMPDGGAGKNTKGELMTTQAAKDYLAAISPTRTKVLEAMARRVDAITAGTRKMLVAEGLEKQDTIDAWEKAYKNYVPMFRDEAESGAPPAHPQGSGFTVRGSASRRATGSTKQVTNMLAHVLMQREAAITRAEKNRVALSLYGLALSNPNPDFWTTIKPGMSQAKIEAELTAMGVDPATAMLGMERAPSIRTVDEATGKVINRPNPMYRNLPGAIPLKVNGEDRVLMLNTSDARGQRLAESLKNLDGLTRLDIAGSIVGKATRWLASVNTQYNPAFGLVNVTRDVLGAAVNLGNTELRGSTIKVLRDTIPAMQGIARELAVDGKGGKWGKLWQQFQADGGKTGWKENWRDPNERAKAIEKELKAAQKADTLTPGKAAHAMLDLLDGFNTTLENAVRLSAYKAALDKGMSRAQAAKLGRELTVDFNRKGRLGRELGPLYAFFNASVQGTARTIQTLNGPTGAKVIAGGLGLGVLQAIALAAAGYDDDEVPEFIKARAFIIPLPEKDGEKRYIQIPLPLGLHAIPNTGRVLTEMVLSGGKDLGEKSFDAIGEIAGAMNPLGGGNVTTMHGALTTVAPSVVDPLIDIGFNKNFFGSNIERESFRESDTRPGTARVKESTARSTTGQAYIGIAEAINSLTGGTKYEAGKLSPTPERVRYLAQTVGGGVLRETEKIINGLTSDEEVKSSQIPVLGRFYGEVDDKQVQTSRYFREKDRADSATSAFKAMEKAGDSEAMEKFIEERPEIYAAEMLAKVQRQISALNKLAVTTIDDPKALADIDAARAELMTEANAAIKDLEAMGAKERGEKPTLGDRLRARAKERAAAD